MIDLSERKKAEAQLAFHDELNRLTTRLAGRFLTAKASNSEKVMREAMGEIGEFFEVDRCSFYLADAEYKEALATYFWTKSDVDEAAEPVQVIPREWFPKFYDWIFVQRQIAIIEFDELAESFKKLSRQLLTANFRNALILPIVVGDRVIGFLAASDSQDPRKWEHSRVAALNVLGEILGSAYDRHQTREQLAEINTNLGKLVEERTVQLRTANAELEAFSYSVSHDLRSPLRTIDGFSELLLQEHSGQLGDNGRAFLSRVRTSSQQMGSLIDALLELARTSRAPGTQQTIDLTVIAEFVAAQLQESSRVKFEIATDLKLIGDQRLIGLLITRLFSNAVKTAPRGSTIEFGAEGGAYFVRHPAPDLKPKTATISSEHDRPGNQTDQLDNGSAGLVTIRHIVDLHGGRIWDTSSNVKTKTICFTLSPTSPDKSLVRAT
ncbi:MAG: signal transduction histidine kinase [Hyphomicrobiaceae bacterium]